MATTRGSSRKRTARRASPRLPATITIAGALIALSIVCLPLLAFAQGPETPEPTPEQTTETSPSPSTTPSVGAQLNHPTGRKPRPEATGSPIEGPRATGRARAALASIAAAERAHFKAHGVFSWKFGELTTAGYDPVQSVAVRILYVTADGRFCAAAVDQADGEKMLFIDERRDEASASRCG